MSQVVTGAVLCGGAAVYVHNNYSPAARVKLMNQDVDEAVKLFATVIRQRDRLQTEEGKAYLAHSREELMNVIHLLSATSKVKKEIARAPLIKRYISWCFKDLATTEQSVKDFCDDANNTTQAVTAVLSDGFPEHVSKEQIYQEVREVRKDVSKLSPASPSPSVAKPSLVLTSKSLSTIRENELGWTT